MAGGRPIEYNAEKIGKAISSYLKDCKANFYLPTVAGVAVHLSVARDTVYDWCEKYPEFSDTIEQIKALQESMLIQNGLKNEYNATITKLMLSSNHGYREKQETDIKSDGKAIVFMPGEIADKNGINMNATDTSPEGNS